MHESAAAKAVFKGILDQLPKGPEVRVASLEIQVGELAGLDPHELDHCIEEMAPGTPLEGAQIRVAQAAAERVCKGCGRRSADLSSGPCPRCGAKEYHLASLAGIRIVTLKLVGGNDIGGLQGSFGG